MLVISYKIRTVCCHRQKIWPKPKTDDTRPKRSHTSLTDNTIVVILNIKRTESILEDNEIRPNNAPTIRRVVQDSMDMQHASNPRRTTASIVSKIFLNYIYIKVLLDLYSTYDIDIELSATMIFTQKTKLSEMLLTCYKTYFSVKENTLNLPLLL